MSPADRPDPIHHAAVGRAHPSRITGAARATRVPHARRPSGRTTRHRHDVPPDDTRRPTAATTYRPAHHRDGATATTSRQSDTIDQRARWAGSDPPPSVPAAAATQAGRINY